MLKVIGDSMIDVAICDGDYVVIPSQKSCEKGEIIAAMIDLSPTSGYCPPMIPTPPSMATSVKSWARSLR